MENCIFCKIVKSRAEATKVFESNKLLAFLDIKPINEGHLLVIPKKHVVLINELDDSVVSEMFVAAQKLNKALRNSGVRCEGVDYFLADGEAAGQEVPHVHLHLIPRFKDDGFGFKFPDHYGNLPSREELNRTGKDIRNGMIN